MNWSEIEFSKPNPPNCDDANTAVSNVPKIPPTPCTGNTSRDHLFLTCF
jgi:hypothetical protein